MSKERSKRTRQYRAPSKKAELLRQHHLHPCWSADFLSLHWSLRLLSGGGLAILRACTTGHLPERHNPTNISSRRFAQSNLGSGEEDLV